MAQGITHQTLPPQDEKDPQNRRKETHGDDRQEGPLHELIVQKTPIKEIHEPPPDPVHAR